MDRLKTLVHLVAISLMLIGNAIAMKRSPEWENEDFKKIRDEELRKKYEKTRLQEHITAMEIARRTKARVKTKKQLRRTSSSGK